MRTKLSIKIKKSKCCSCNWSKITIAFCRTVVFCFSKRVCASVRDKDKDQTPPLDHWDILLPEFQEFINITEQCIVLPSPSPVLVQKLWSWQHDVKLYRRPGGNQILWFRCRLLDTAADVNTSWLSSVAKGWEIMKKTWLIQHFQTILLWKKWLILQIPWMKKP